MQTTIECADCKNQAQYCWVFELRSTALFHLSENIKVRMFEFIDRIEVSPADKKSKPSEIIIVYNFIGAFDFTWAIEEAHNTTQKQQKTA